MTTLTLTSNTAVSSSTSFLAALAGAIAEFRAGAREGRQIEARYDALSRKSNTELAAIGLTRSEITRVALTGRRC